MLSPLVQMGGLLLVFPIKQKNSCNGGDNNNHFFILKNDFMLGILVFMPNNDEKGLHIVLQWSMIIFLQQNFEIKNKMSTNRVL